VMAVLVLMLGLVLSATTGIENASPSYVFALLILVSSRNAGERGNLYGGRLVCGAMLCAFSARLALPMIKGPYAAASQNLILPAGPWRGLDFMPGVAGRAERAELISQVWIQPRNMIDNLWYLYLEDADRMLRPLVGSGDRVLSLDYINPFPYLLDLPAPRGDHLYWSFDRNVSPQTAPAPAALCADADWVMVPRLELFHDSSSMKQHLYLPWIKAHYRLQESSPWWDCYRRRVAQGPTVGLTPR